MPISRAGRLAASAYLLVVLGVLLTWLIGGHDSTPALGITLILTAPVGVVGYGVLESRPWRSKATAH